MKITCSFVIVTFQRPKEILEAVNSVLVQQGDFEIIIIDNNPNSDLKTRLPDDNRIRLFSQMNNMGYVWARNFGAKVAKSEIIVFLDDDAELVTENALERIISNFNDNPCVACLAFQIRNYYSNSIVPKEFPHPDIKIADKRSLVSYYVGAGHAFRRDILEDLGPFLDLDYGGEELEYSYRLINNGHHILYVPDVVVVHKAAIGGRHSYGKNIFYSVRNRMWVTSRHLPLVYFIVNNFLWNLIWLVSAFKSKSIKYYTKGLIDGLKKISQTIRHKQRSALSCHAISYLKKNGGRLWF